MSSSPRKTDRPGTGSHASLKPLIRFYLLLLAAVVLIVAAVAIWGPRALIVAGVAAAVVAMVLRMVIGPRG